MTIFRSDNAGFMNSFDYDGRQVTNFILDYCDQKNRNITNLALQKILYFLHVWTLIDFGAPLIRHRFEAWEHGPVLQYIYREFSSFGANPISKRATSLDENGTLLTSGYDFPPKLEATLLEKVEFYSRLSGSQLREMSHVRGGPWWKAWNHTGPANPGMRIENDAIIEFYVHQKRNPSMHQ